MVPVKFMMTSSNGNSPVTGEFPSQRPVTRRFDVLFDMCLNKRLSKQSWGWWFETPSRPLWRHCNVPSSFTEKLIDSSKAEIKKITRQCLSWVRVLSNRIVYIQMIKVNDIIIFIHTDLLSLRTVISNNSLNACLWVEKWIVLVVRNPVKQCNCPNK